MSIFGQQPSTGGSLFGGGNNTTGSIFGQSNPQQQQQAPTASIFGAANTGQNNQQSSGLFGGLGNNNQNQQQIAQTGGLFGGFGNNAQTQQQPAQSGGLFGGLGNNQQTQQGSSIFGGNNNASQQTQQQTGSIFGGGLGNNQQGQQQNAPFGGSTFGGQSQQAQNQVQQAQQQPMYTASTQADNSIPGQIEKIRNKWDPSHPDCAFKHYFYNKVEESKAPFYNPQPRDDPKAWEEALSKKPGQAFIPVSCIGFVELGDRIKSQQYNLALFNQQLHAINNSLEAMLSKHDLEFSVRALDARRRHTVLKQRAMALATKVQILRNRGYALGGDEEELKAKLQSLEKGILDPGLAARGEEIWARMVGVRERAKIVKEEMNKRAGANGSGLDEETAKRAEKILEDYGKQLGHLKRELAHVSEELQEWTKDQPAQIAER